MNINDTKDRYVHAIPYIIHKIMKIEDFHNKAPKDTQNTQTMAVERHASTMRMPVLKKIDLMKSFGIKYSL